MKDLRKKNQYSLNLAYQIEEIIKKSKPNNNNNKISDNNNKFSFPSTNNLSSRTENKSNSNRWKNSNSVKSIRNQINSQRLSHKKIINVNIVKKNE